MPDPFQARLLATLSHELRTPLHVILGLVEMLEDLDRGDPQRSRLVERIKGAATGLVALVDGALAAAEDETTREAPADAGQVLVIEDDVDSREAILAVLEACGHSAVGAANGHDGLELLRTGHRPGFIVLDLMMPVMDGWQFRRAQLRETELASIPTLVCTARGDDGGLTRDLGAVGYLQKPINFDRLLEIVETHCPRS